VPSAFARWAATSLGPTLSRGPRPVGQLLVGCAFVAHFILLLNSSRSRSSKTHRGSGGLFPELRPQARTLCTGGSGVDSNSRTLSGCRFSRPVP
jgi:hypothetical protein